ncbi:hypothetical protein JTB14_016281 [Gonioctena quinquepunctata]|nr:hypothetical protein JTB14_016281 [Gonioctena quinquepunctata]
MAFPNIMVLSDSSIFRWFACCSSALVVKMMFMSIYTGYQRFKHKAFVNPEDTKKMGIEPAQHEDVERAKRAHLNDLENIPIFFVSGFLYTLTEPADWAAKSLFLTYTIARIAHTLVYAVWVVPQPARAFSFSIGGLITLFMTISNFIYFTSNHFEY